MKIQIFENPRFSRKIRDFSSLKYFIPIFFISIIALYVLPLSLFNYSSLVPSGNISSHFDSFSDYIPIALFLSSLFILIFSFFYRQLTFRDLKTHNFKQLKKFKKHELFIIYILFTLSLWMLYQLSKDVGGLLNLILSGYGVTELFINKGHYASGFDWIVTLSILLWGNALVTKNKKIIIFNLLLLIVITVSFAIMGRRSVILIILGSSIYMYHQFYKPLKLYKLIGFSLLGFYFLSMIGFLRGGSYRDISSLINIIQEIFQAGTLPTSICFQTLVMLPNEEKGDFRVIRLIESVWKIISSIINSTSINVYFIHCSNTISLS
jgi:oligosaccharide repeat unit polymerase